MSGRSWVMAKKGTAMKHLTGRRWKLICNADVNITSPLPTASVSGEDLNPLDGDSGAIVDGKPGCRFAFCVAKKSNIVNNLRAPSVSIDTMGCSEAAEVVPDWMVVICRR